MGCGRSVVLPFRAHNFFFCSSMGITYLLFNGKLCDNFWYLFFACWNICGEKIIPIVVGSAALPPNGLGPLFLIVQGIYSPVCNLCFFLYNLKKLFFYLNVGKLNVFKVLIKRAIVRKMVVRGWVLSSDIVQIVQIVQTVQIDIYDVANTINFMFSGQFLI